MRRCRHLRLSCPSSTALKRTCGPSARSSSSASLARRPSRRRAPTHLRHSTSATKCSDPSEYCRRTETLMMFCACAVFPSGRRQRWPISSCGYSSATPKTVSTSVSCTPSGVAIRCLTTHSLCRRLLQSPISARGCAGDRPTTSRSAVFVGSRRHGLATFACYQAARK